MEAQRTKLRIGVTGHRVLAYPDLLCPAIDECFNRIERDFPGAQWTMVSSLAEGADRLVLERARARTATGLLVPLPMSRDEYSRDFASPESRSEFIRLLDGADGVIEAPATESRNEAYAAAGKALVDASDVLIAVWDGEVAQGAAGTGDVVTRARMRGLPVAWVHAGNRKPGTTEPTSLGRQQGMVTFERFPPSTPANPPLRDPHLSVSNEPSDACSQRISEALARRDALALRHQARRLNFGRFAVSLGPFSVLLLAIQTLWFPAGGAIATTLILVELAALAVALGIGFLEMGKSHDLWIRERLRAEVIRREMFLFRARVGPYLTGSGAELSRRVEQRLVALDNDISDPVTVIAMEDEHTCWRDALEDAGHSAWLPVPKFKETLRTYLAERVEDQRKWFTSKSLSHGTQARFYENGAKVILLVALMAAALHLGLLMSTAPTGAEWLHPFLIFVALIAPPLGSSFVALLSMIGSHRLCKSYLLRAGALERVEASLRQLQSELDSVSADDQDTQFLFKRIVLKSEELLSSDLLQWWLVMSAEAPRAVP